jgi:hypothetical protein
MQVILPKERLHCCPAIAMVAEFPHCRDQIQKEAMFLSHTVDHLKTETLKGNLTGHAATTIDIVPLSLDVVMSSGRVIVVITTKKNVMKGNESHATRFW